MGERRTVVVAGAGIGGLTAALALAHANFQVIVVERAAELSEAGAGIQLSPNAGRVLARLGLDRAVAARAVEPEAIDIRSGRNGATLTSIPATAFRDRYKFPYRVIHRADLQGALLQGIRRHESIALETGATISETLEQPDGLLVRIARAGGSSVVPAEMVVAADGVWSSLRERIPGAAAAAATGMTAWRAVIASDIAAQLAPLDRVSLWLGRGAHLVHYPIAKGAALNIVAVVPETWEKQGWNAPGDMAEIGKHFAGWHENVRRLIAAPLAWQRFAIATVDATAQWVHGRIALLGDAAHAMPPYLAQGAAMAMEDSAVLAHHLRSAPDLTSALRGYEIGRRARVMQVSTATTDTAKIYHAAGLAAHGRDLALRLAGARLGLRRNDWIYRWRPPGSDGGAAGAPGMRELQPPP
jgi:salicylate hydroxylase